MANPLTEERLNHLKDQATELLKDFSILYLANFGACYFEKVKSELQPEEKSEWKLKHREFNSVPRKSPSSGCCYMKKGEGPGDFDKWKKVFVVERSDYNIDVFGSEKEYQSGKKPSSTIRTAGYTILQSQVAQHYSSQLNQLASGLGMTEVEVEEMTNFFPCTWALCHPQRINYIFQIPEIKDKSFFSCFGSKNQVEPTFDEESDKERNRLMDIMQTCVKINHPRDVKCVHGAAFDKSCKAIPSKVSSLSKWKDDGSEGEMLVDMLMEACLSDLRDGILSDLKGPTSMKLAVWYKTRGVIQTTLAKLADPAMTQMQNGAKKIEEKIDPVIRPGLVKILEFKSSVEDKIKNKILSKLGEMIGKFVTPFLKPFLTAFEQPLNKGFENGKAYFNGEISVVNLPDNVEQRNSLLDGMSRSEECVKQVENTSKELVEPLNALKKISKDVFDDMDVDELRTKAHQLLLQTLDAAIYTIEQRLDAGQAKQDSLKTEILQDYEHDAKLARSIFVQEVVSSILITAFKKLISPVTDPLIDEFNNTIPPEMQDFLDVQQILDNLVEFIVGEPINSMVEVMYPKP